MLPKSSEDGENMEGITKLQRFDATSMVPSPVLHPPTGSTGQSLFAVAKPRLENLLLDPVTKQCKIFACYNPIRAPRQCLGKSRP